MHGTQSLTRKFHHSKTTADGEVRASIDWRGLKTLWLNTGTLCNIECANCYIESSPTNDSLVYLRLTDVTPFLNEIDAAGDGPVEIGITGGEPFMAPEILVIMETCLGRGHTLLLLTNAMQPMMRPAIRTGLLELQEAYGDQLTLRVSLDHHSADLHDKERGKGSFEITMKGLRWLAANDFRIALAGRQAMNEDDATTRAAYGRLITDTGLDIDPADTKRLVLFPEMISGDDPPEITTACWGILGVDPANMMCASQRMVIRRKGASHATLTACTLLAYDKRFELGETLAEATAKPVSLNHPWCASFCVLGGGSCSA